jgi:phospholipase C
MALAAAAAVLLALVPLSAAAAPAAEPTTTTPIKHLVMLMQDNHSFDNYFGTYPGADGIPPGTCLPVRITTPTDECVKPFHLGGGPVEDLGHGVGVQKRQYNNGKMDGFVAAYRRLGQDGTSAAGYYDGRDLPYYWNVADEYVLFDRFFSSTTVGARESYLYWTAGTAPASDRPLTSSAGYNRLPTIFDRLAAKNVSAKFYVENFDQRATGPQGAKYSRQSQSIKVPLLSMQRFRDGGDLEGRVADLDEYYTDLRSGTLPAVSYIVTSGSSENPPASLKAGQALVRKLTTELARSSAWDTSAFMWTYDGWGGWYDHVPPPKVDARGYGFRVPALLVSPYARRGVVDHTVLDYTAMLKFIETNWQVAPLSTRDAASPGLASAFDFAAEPRPAQIVSPDRVLERPLESARSPAPVIYATYGFALALVAAIAGAALMVGTPAGTRIATSPPALWILPRLQAARSHPRWPTAARTALRRWTRRWRPVESGQLPEGVTWQYRGWNWTPPLKPTTLGTFDNQRAGQVTPPTRVHARRPWYRRTGANRVGRSASAAPALLRSLRGYLRPGEPARLPDGSIRRKWYQSRRGSVADHVDQVARREAARPQQSPGHVPSKATARGPGDRGIIAVVVVTVLVTLSAATGWLVAKPAPSAGPPAVTRNAPPASGPTGAAAPQASAPASDPAPEMPAETADEDGGDASPGPAPTIELQTTADSAEPFETVRIQGRFPAGANTYLRVERREGGRWLAFPLPTRTDRSGRFTAHVELGQPGRYQLRVVEPESKVRSDTFVLVIER